MPAIFFALLAASLWGVGQVFTKKGFEETSPLFNNLLGAFITLIIVVPFALLNGANFQTAQKIFPLSLLIALLLLCYYYILEKGYVSLTGTILSSYPLITVVLSFLFLREQPSIFQKIAIVIILLGTITIAAGESINAVKRLRFGGWFWLAVIGAVSIGFSDFFAKVAVNNSDIYSYLLAYGISFPILAGISYIFDYKNRAFPKFNSKKFLPTAIGVTMLEVGLMIYYIALSKGLVSVVTPLSSIYAAITVILAWIFLKEKMNKIQLLGITFSILGIIFIGIG